MNKYQTAKIWYLGLFILVAVSGFVWYAIFFGDGAENLELYFLDVGQGDSQLIMYGGVKILVDGGPANSKALENLGRILPAADRYLDLVILTHPQLDHYGGLIDVLKNYAVGVFIVNGRKGETDAYQGLAEIIKDKQIPYISLAEGSFVRHQDLSLKVLSPSLKNLQSNELNDGSLVFLLEKDGVRALYTGDIGTKVEKELVKKYDLGAHILKVGHHGSRFSSAAEFLREVAPRISVIEVGKNTYGHPTGAVLSRLADVRSQIFRTDQDGLVKLVIRDGRLIVFRD